MQRNSDSQGRSQRPSSSSRTTASSKLNAIPTTARVVLVDPKKKKNPVLQVLIIGGGLVLFAVSFGKLLAPEGTVPMGRPLIPTDSAFSQDSFAIFDTAQTEASKWQNPDTSMLKKSFCSGSKTSSGCSNEAVHPFVTEFDRAGWTVEEYEKYLGWTNTPTAEENRVIEDTMYYSNKSFKLFGK